MNKNIDYTIAIRTLGYGGEKYKKLLRSIKKLTNKPREILVIVPYGYNKPVEILGNEKIIYSKKGMLEQRIVGIENSKSKYTMLLDDDIEFEEKIIEKLYESMINKNASIAFPIYEELLPQGKLKKFICSLTLSATSRKEDDFYIKMKRSGGFSYPRSLNKIELYSESAPGMCVFGETEVLTKINLREDTWVTIPEYELREDAILIYKAFLNGENIIGRIDIEIKHLDNSIGDLQRRKKAIYALGCSQIKFWEKYIYLKKENKLLNIFSIFYWCLTNIMLSFIMGIKKMDFNDLKFLVLGINRGLKND